VKRVIKLSPGRLVVNMKLKQTTVNCDCCWNAYWIATRV